MERWWYIWMFIYITTWWWCSFYPSIKRKGSISISVSFWDINNYTHQQSIKRYSVYGSTHMVELSNGNIALSVIGCPYPIVINDSLSYQIVTMIQLKEYITLESSLCVWWALIHLCLWRYIPSDIKWRYFNSISIRRGKI